MFRPSHLLYLLAAALVLAFSGCTKQNQLSKHLAAADRHFRAGDYDKAEVEYRNVLQIEPNNAAAIAGLGIIHLDQGRILRAIPALAHARQLQPDNVTLRTKLAIAYLALRRFDDARAEASQVLSLAPNHSEAPVVLVESANTQEALDAVRTQLQALPEEVRDTAPVLTAFATITLREKGVEAALPAYEQAIARDPNYVPALIAIGAIRASRGEAEAAEAAFAKAAALSPPRSPRRLQYAQYLLGKGDAVAAKRHVEQMTEDAPDYLPAWLFLARLALNEKDFETSRRLVDRVLARESAQPEARLLSIQLRLSQAEYEKAVSEAEDALRLFPSSPPLLHQLALGYAATGQNEKALTTVNQAVALAPGFSEAALLQASLSARTGDVGGAIVTLENLLAQRPQTLEAALMLAAAHRSQNNPAAALQVYDQIAERFPDFPQTPLLRGQVLRRLNRVDEARQAFALALERDPNSIAALEQLINLDLAERQFDSAKDRLDAALAKQPDSAHLHLIHARVLMASGDRDRAEAALLKAVELAPDSPGPYGTLASFYLASNRQDEALANFEEVVERNPRDVRAWMILGMLKQNQQRHAEALEAYEKVLAVNPRFAVALNNAAYLYSEYLHDPEKAFAAAQQARELQPHDPNIADTLGWIVYKRKQYSWALTLLRESAEKLPESPEVNYHLGVVHYIMGNEAAARAALQRALDLDAAFPGHQDARHRLAVLAIDLNAPDPANESMLVRLLERQPDDPAVLVRLGVLREREGERADAAELYGRALQASPENVTAMTQLIRLDLAEGRTEEALQLARNARKFAPDNPEVAHALGRAAYASGDHSWAYSLLQEAARRQPENAEIQRDLGWAAYGIGQVTEATAAFRSALHTAPAAPWSGELRVALDLIRAASGPAEAAAAAATIERELEKHPTNAPALMAAAVMEEHRGAIKAATRHYEDLLKLLPEFSPAKRRLAILYAATGENDARAATLAAEARNRFQEDAELAKAYGQVLYRQKDYSRALPLLQEASAVFLSDASLLHNLGMAQHHLNDASARETLTRALQLGLSDSLATEARQALEAQ